MIDFPPEEWELKQAADDPDGIARARGLTVLEVHGDGAKVFMRNSLRNALSEASEHTRTLVGELNGVRVYISRNKIVMTMEDVYR